MICTTDFNTCTALFLNFVTFCRFFCCFKVDFNLQKTSAEVNSVDFLSLISLECVWLLDCFIQVRQSTPLDPWFVLKILLLRLSQNIIKFCPLV